MTSRRPIVMLDPQELTPGQYVLTVETVGAGTRMTLQPVSETVAQQQTVTVLVAGVPQPVFTNNEWVTTEVSNA